MAELDEVVVQCPYCGESVELSIDPDTSGSMVQDCEVCCSPWHVNVRRGPSGRPTVTVERIQ
jgi:hypothetical protein